VSLSEFPGKATNAQTRERNASLVLRVLYDLGPISRASIARLTGLTRTSVGELVSDLERDGLARDVGRGPSTGGKAPTLVALEPDARSVITVDLGERWFTAALANLRGDLSHVSSREVDGRDGDAALQLVFDLIGEVRDAASRPLLGIGVGTPGIVDSTGTIRWAVNLDWQDLPLGTILQEHFGTPAMVVNDSRAAAIATYLFGGEDRPQQLVAIKVGRGVGSGLVLRGQLFDGDGHGAGEIGHIVVDPDGARCHCGRFGCLETVASIPAVLDAASQAGLDVATVEGLASMAAADDERALAVVRTAGRSIGAAIAAMTGVLDVRHITVLGQATALGAPWFAAIREEAARRTLGPLAGDLRIVDGGPGDDATLLGACALLLTHELGLTVHR
jgi:N-acetylglucosamine repressor